MDTVFISQRLWNSISAACFEGTESRYHSLQQALALYIQGAALVTLSDEVGTLQTPGSVYITFGDLPIVDRQGQETSMRVVYASTRNAIIVVIPEELQLGQWFHVDRQLIRVEIARAAHQRQNIREQLKRARIP